MAIPTFATVTANRGPVGGLFTVRITGTNFKVPVLPLVGAPSTPVPPTVAVYFADERAQIVDVLSSTLLVVRVPPYHGAAPDGALPPVAIKIQNLDNAGAPIPTEEVTAAAAFTYDRPDIHASQADANIVDSPYTLVSIELVNFLRRNVLANTTMTTHVDFSEPGVLTVNVSTIPAMVVQGPTVTRDSAYWDNELLTVESSPGVFTTRKPPYVARLAYTIIGVSDNERELLNMQGSVMEAFERVKHLSVAVDQLNPTSARAELVLQLTNPPQTTSAPSESNIRTFAAVCEVRGVAVRETQTIAENYEVTDPTLEVTVIGSIDDEEIPI